MRQYLGFEKVVEILRSDLIAESCLAVACFARFREIGLMRGWGVNNQSKCLARHLLNVCRCADLVQFKGKLKIAAVA